MIYDYIIVGSGAAGLNAARNIPKNKKVLILCKKNVWNCNTFYAQGGIAGAKNSDDVSFHIKDTLVAGVYHNNKEAVEILSKKSLFMFENLINSGMKFDLNAKGELAYTKEAAHSKSRILHANGDATGRILHLFLLRNSLHKIVTNATVCDLLIKDDICYGVQYIDDTNRNKIAYAHNTILASGGVGTLYKYHTNTTANCGEIQGIILEKGLALKDMEMMQFHPTVLKGAKSKRKHLLSEALRGEGAYIVDSKNRRFLFDYHKDGELAPRDVVSRSIYDYKITTGEQIYLSLEKFEKDMFKRRFPNISANLENFGYEIPKCKIPISPAFHYSMGGVKTDLSTKVLGMRNLYAVGEVACSGVHGANRLASNSLMETLVFSQICVEKSLEENYKIEIKNYNLALKEYEIEKSVDKQIREELASIMWKNVGVIREKKELEEAKIKIDNFLKKDVGRLLFLSLLTAQSIIEFALQRESSLGAHYMKEN